MTVEPSVRDTVSRFIDTTVVGRKNMLYYDYQKAKMYYDAYTISDVVCNISRLDFLFLWFTSTRSKSSDKLMSDYAYFFEGSNINSATISYRTFCESYARTQSVEVGIDMNYSCSFITRVHYLVPISQRYILDKLQLNTTNDFVHLVEGNMVTLKCRPKIMSTTFESVRSYQQLPDNTLQAIYEFTQVTSSLDGATIESTDYSAHTKVVEAIERICGSYNRVEHLKFQQRFLLPRREMNYLQILDYLSKRQVPYNSILGKEEITIDDFINSSKCIIFNRILTADECYKGKDDEMYRLAGDKVLEIQIHGNCSRTDAQDRIMQMYENIDFSIVEQFPTVEELSPSGLSKLRASNPTIFNSVYCRKACPEKQLDVIQRGDIERCKKQGKMILFYEGTYYTTKGNVIPGGHNYIGIINKFGDYQPGKYVPSLRAYKTCHLIGRPYKELKAYLLRKSPTPGIGMIDPTDIILPLHLEYLYNLPLVNEPPKMGMKHTKKSSGKQDVKTYTGDVPDYIKSVFGIISITRKMVKEGKGTRLLEACEILGENRDKFRDYACEHIANAPDLVAVNVDQMLHDIDNGDMDSRVYSKIISDYLQADIITFSTDSVIPYRYSKYANYNAVIVLFLSKSGIYDRCVFDTSTEQARVSILQGIAQVRKLCNDKDISMLCDLKALPTRPIDYTYTHLCLVSFLQRWCNINNVVVTYQLIEESKCAELVEQVYNNVIYYEGKVKKPNPEYSAALVQKTYAYEIELNLALICQALKPLVVDYTTTRATVLSPVDMTKYHPWNIRLEDCLYSNISCFNLSERDEIRREYLKMDEASE